MSGKYYCGETRWTTKCLKWTLIFPFGRICIEKCTDDNISPPNEIPPHWKAFMHVTRQTHPVSAGFDIATSQLRRNVRSPFSEANKQKAVIQLRISGKLICIHRGARVRPCFPFFLCLVPSTWGHKVLQLKFMCDINSAIKRPSKARVIADGSMMITGAQ